MRNGSNNYNAADLEVLRGLEPVKRRPGMYTDTTRLLLRPDLVDEAYRTLPAARYSWPERVVPNYPLRKGGQGYVGHPALADPAFARAAGEVLIAEAMVIVEGLLEGAFTPAERHSPFFRVPLFRTNFWPVAAVCALALTGLAVAALAALGARGNHHRRQGDAPAAGAPPSRLTGTWPGTSTPGAPRRSPTRA